MFSALGIIDHYDTVAATPEIHEFRENTRQLAGYTVFDGQKSVAGWSRGYPEVDAVSPSCMTGQTILVVDDHAAVRENLVEILQAEGFATATAENGLEALEYLRDSVPDLILCDAVMPGMGGFEFLDALRADPRIATIPLVFLTGKSEREDFRQGMDLGADDYLTKPWTIDGVLSVIRTRLKRRDELTSRQSSRLRQIGEEVLRSIPLDMLAPLRGIVGCSDVLAEHCTQLGQAHVQELSADIRNSSRRLFRSVENFEFLMRLATDKMNADGRDEPADVADVVRSAATETARIARRESDLTVRVEGGRALLPRRATTKIVSEIVDNAFEFSAPGTGVLVEVSVASPCVLVRVSDHGPGIPTAVLQSMLPVGGAPGTGPVKFRQGSGLTVCRAILDHLGATWRFETAPSSGTVITLEFLESTL